MKCPVCRSYGPHEEFEVQTAEVVDILTCSACGAVWSVSHAVVEVIRDPQHGSFLAVAGDCVEADDYNYAA